MEKKKGGGLPFATQGALFLFPSSSLPIPSPSLFKNFPCREKRPPPLSEVEMLFHRNKKPPKKKKKKKKKNPNVFFPRGWIKEEKQRNGHAWKTKDQNFLEGESSKNQAESHSTTKNFREEGGASSPKPVLKTLLLNTLPWRRFFTRRQVTFSSGEDTGFLFLAFHFVKREKVKADLPVLTIFSLNSFHPS